MVTIVRSAASLALAQAAAALSPSCETRYSRQRLRAPCSPSRALLSSRLRPWTPCAPFRASPCFLQRPLYPCALYCDPRTLCSPFRASSSPRTVPHGPSDPPSSLQTRLPSFRDLSGSTEAQLKILLIKGGGFEVQSFEEKGK